MINFKSIIYFLILFSIFVSPSVATSLEINGGSQTLDGDHTYDYVNITNGGVLYVTPYDGTGTTGRLNLTIVHDLNVDSTSSINGYKSGYRGGNWTTVALGGEPIGYGGGANGYACLGGTDGEGGGGSGGTV